MRLRAVPYPVVCAVLGLLLGWLPALVHGPIPEKFNVHYIDGSIAVWGHQSARLLVGLLVGLTVWPERWWLRGPLVGFLALLPVTFVSLAMPECGFPCMRWNWLTGATIGAAVGGLAYAITGKQSLSPR